MDIHAKSLRPLLPQFRIVGHHVDHHTLILFYFQDLHTSFAPLLSSGPKWDDMEMTTILEHLTLLSLLLAKPVAARPVTTRSLTSPGGPEVPACRNKNASRPAASDSW
jgi:hypothetical protein